MKDNKFKQSLISIIVPVYNVEKYLNQCVESILSQTYKNIEILLVDDGSTDNSGKICDEYALKDNRIKVIHKQNGGLSDARNVGIEASIGDYLMFVDSDDWVAEDYVKLLYENLIETGADMSICGFFCFYNNDKIEKGSTIITKDEIVDKNDMFYRMTDDNGWQYVVAWNKIYKRKLFENIRYPVPKLHEDVFVAHHLFNKCKNISIISNPLVFYRRRENSITLQKITFNRMINIFEHEVDRFEFYKSENLVYLKNFYLKSVYSKTLQIIQMMNKKNKDTVFEILKKSLRVMKLNLRAINCVLLYLKNLISIVRSK